MMTAVVVVDAETITVRGPQVRDCLRRSRLRPIYIHGRDAQGWVLDRRRLGDAVAALERNNYAVQMEGEPVAPAQLSAPDSVRLQAIDPAPVTEHPGDITTGMVSDGLW